MQKVAHLLPKGILGEPDGAVVCKKAAQLFPKGVLGEPDGAVACKKLLTYFQKESLPNLTVRWHESCSNVNPYTEREG